MDYEKLADQLRFSTPKSLLIVNFNNLLQEIFCPFKVTVLVNVGGLVKGQEAWVEEIRVTKELRTVYIINGMGYHYHYFDIAIIE